MCRYAKTINSVVFVTNSLHVTLTLIAAFTQVVLIRSSVISFVIRDIDIVDYFGCLFKWEIWISGSSRMQF